jgi:hypothetical protein
MTGDPDVIRSGKSGPANRKQSTSRRKTGFEVLTAYEARRTTGHILPKNQSHSFDDAEVALRSGSKSLQRGLIGGTIVSRYSLFETLELYHHDALVHA